MLLEPTELISLSILCTTLHISLRLECSRSQSNVAYGQQARLMPFHCRSLLGLCELLWFPITESAKVHRSASTKVLHVTHAYYSNKTFLLSSCATHSMPALFHFYLIVEHVDIPCLLLQRVFAFRVSAVNECVHVHLYVLWRMCGVLFLCSFVYFALIAF